MNTIAIHAGDILSDQESKVEYGIVFINANSNLLIACERNTTKLLLSTFPLDIVYKKVVSGAFTIVEKEEVVYDEDNMSASAIEANKKRADFIKDVANKYGPDYSALLKKNYDSYIKHELTKKYGISHTTAYNLIRKYLQSGCDINSVYDKKTLGVNGKAKSNYKIKTGKKPDLGSQGIIITDDVKAIFDKVLNYYASGRSKSYKFVYNLMIAEYFCDQREIDGGIQYVPFPINERPTYAQFYYYAKKKFSVEEIGVIKTSRMEYRNNMRLIRSDVQKAAIAPAYITEMDELESDLELVDSQTRTMNIGRAIVYCLIDVCTRLIMAVSVSLENNSVRGFTNCFMFLADDKRKIANRYGLDFDDTMWPSGYLPKIIRTDRGSEYMSGEVGRICNELGITLEPVPAGTGSLKGVVEQSFHQLHCSINPLTERRGLITKRNDSNHHKQAKLTITEFTKIVLNCALAHNTSTIEKFKLSARQTKDGVYPIPIVLWQDGCNHGLEPKKIINKEQFAWTLMTKESGKISRNGLTVNGINYLPVNDADLENHMAKAGNKSVPFECRMDRRIVDRVYYLKDNKLRYCELNAESTDNAEFKGLMFEDAMALKKARRLLIAKSKRKTDDTNVFTVMTNKQTVENAVRETNTALKNASNTGSPKKEVDTTNIKKNRAAERRTVMEEHYIGNRLLGDNQSGAFTSTKSSDTNYTSPDVSDDFDAFFSDDETDWSKAIKDERKEE